MSERPQPTESGKNLPPLLDTHSIGRLIEMIHRISPEIGARMVAPNVILCLSGMKPLADAILDSSEVVDQEDPNIVEAIKNANILLKSASPDIFLSSSGVVTKHLFGDKQSVSLHVLNLRGFERVSKLSRIPGVPIYDRATGFQGLDEWHKELQTAIHNAQQRGELPADEVAHEIVIQGIERGYPDQAILDFLNWYLTGRTNVLDYANLIREKTPPYAPSPSYTYYPEHATDPAIQENIKQSNEVLSAFFDSEMFRQLQKKI